MTASLIPLTLAAIAAATRIEANLVADILGDQKRLITEIQMDLGSEFGWYKRQLETLSTQLPVQSLKAEAARQALDTYLAYHPVFHEIVLHDVEGKVVAFSVRGSRSVRPEPVTRAPGELRRAFAEVVSAGRSRFTSAAAGSAGLDLHLVAPVPSMRMDGAPVGALVASVRRQSAEIQDLVEGWSYVGSTYVYLTSPDGEVLASAGSARDRHVRQIRVKGTPDAEGVVAGVGGVLGRDDVVASAVLAQHGLVVVVGRPYAEVSRTLDELLWSVSFYVLVGVLVSLILGVLLSRTLVGPILKLTDGIQRVARGEVAHRLGVQRNDELGDAAHAFDEMAAQLQKGRLLEELWQERRARSGDKP